MLAITAQNLVPNPDFETFTSCPTDYGQWNATDWYAPFTLNSPDYFHVCGGPNVGVPTNGTGFQASSTGSAYAGLFTFSPNFAVREYLQVQLSTPTLAGACYQLTVVYSPTDGGGTASGLGIALSQGTPGTPDELVPQLVKTNVDESFTEWHTMTTQYVAVGSEDYLTLGNFYTDANTLWQPGPSGNSLLAYYYVDSVAVEMLGMESSEIVVDLGDDIEICASEFPITISSNLPNLTNVWNTGEVGTSITVNAPGSYIVQSFLGCDYGTDTMNILVFEEPELAIDDINLCVGNSYLIELDASLGPYLWDDGSTEASFLVSTPGIYGVTLTGVCVDIVEEFEVQELADIEIAEPTDLEICETELPFLVDYSSYDDGENEFLWQDGSTGSTFLINMVGTYSVEIFNECYTDNVDFQVDISSVIPTSIDFVDTTSCAGEEVLINTNLTGAEFEWQDGSIDSFFLAPGPGNYSVTITNFCGTEVFDFDIDEIIDPVLDIGGDQFICSGDSLLLYSLGGEVLTWNNGMIGSSIWVYEEGEVVANMPGICGIVSDTIQIAFTGVVPSINLPESVEVCDGDSFTLIATDQVAGVGFLWNTGSTESSITVTEAGTYVVTGSNNCGTMSDSVVVTIGESLADIMLEDIYEVCEGGTVELTVNPEGAAIEWSTGSVDSFVQIMEEGMYYVSLTNSCTTKVDSFLVGIAEELAGINLGDDFGICSGTSEILDVGNLDGVYLWNDGSSEDSLLIEDAGVYSLQIIGTCNMVFDTIEVFDLGISPAIDLGQDTWICEGDSVILDVGAGLDNVLWNTSSIESSITVYTAGTYIVEAENDCGVDSDTVMVTVNNEAIEIDLGLDIQICPGDTVLLDLGNVTGDVIWNTGAVESNIAVFEEGEYYVSLNSNCGNSSDTIEIEILEPAPIIDLGVDVTICQGDSVIIDIGTAIVDDILWNTSSTENTITVFDAGTYFVDGSNTCGVASDTILVTINDQVPTIDLGADQEICPGETVTLDIGNVAGIIEWNTGEDGTSIEVSEGGIYYVSLSSSCGSAEDSVLVDVLEPAPVVDLGADQVLCFGESLDFDLTVGDETTILWNNGAETSENSYTEPGLISVTVSNACGADGDSIILEVIQEVSEVDLGDDVSLCDESNYMISPFIFDFNVDIEWNTGEMTEGIEVTETGEYWMEVSNACFAESDTILVTFGVTPMEFDLGENDTICSGENIFLEEDQGTEFQYSWQDNSTNTAILATESGSYELVISNDCGIVSDQIDILVLPTEEIEVSLDENYLLCDDMPLEIDLSGIVADFIEWNDGSNELFRILINPGNYEIKVENICADTLISFLFEQENCTEDGAVFIPNSFTPNDDGINDLFQIFISENWLSPEVKVSIYNRWGEQLFYSENVDFSWDGTFKGRAVNAGVYAYYIELEVEIDGKSQLFRKAGDISITK